MTQAQIDTLTALAQRDHPCTSVHDVRACVIQVVQGYEPCNDDVMDTAALLHRIDVARGCWF